METLHREGQAPWRALKLATLVGFPTLLVTNLLLGDWLGAAYIFAAGFVFVVGRRIDRWPRPARYLVVLLLAALSAAMFVRLILTAARW
jgi:hypothetical protein